MIFAILFLLLCPVLLIVSLFAIQRLKNRIKILQVKDSEDVKYQVLMQKYIELKKTIKPTNDYSILLKKYIQLQSDYKAFDKEHVELIDGYLSEIHELKSNRALHSISIDVSGMEKQKVERDGFDPSELNHKQLEACVNYFVENYSGKIKR